MIMNVKEKEKEKEKVGNETVTEGKVEKGRKARSG